MPDQILMWLLWGERTFKKIFFFGRKRPQIKKLHKKLFDTPIFFKGVSIKCAQFMLKSRL